MYTIRKEFAFSASHQLSGLSAEHPCSRLHGHNYVVVVELKSEFVDQIGFILDYRALEPIKTYLDTYCDHRHLNDVFDFNPTAENLAKQFYSDFDNILREKLKGVLSKWILAVEVSETPKTSARYEP